MLTEWMLSLEQTTLVFHAGGTIHQERGARHGCLLSPFFGEAFYNFEKTYAM